MSKRKRNVCYIKPELPSFLVKIREQIAYKDERLADLEKRQKLAKYLEGDKDREDENPQVVVLKEGDLTKHEADAEKRKIEKEENEKPADLSQRIIFKGKSKPIDSNKIPIFASSSSSGKEEKSKTKKLKVIKSKLSFTNDDEEETD